MCERNFLPKVPALESHPFLGGWRGGHNVIVKDAKINFSQAWDKEQIWFPCGNWTCDLSNIGWALFPLSYKSSWRARHCFLHLRIESTNFLCSFNGMWTGKEMTSGVICTPWVRVLMFLVTRSSVCQFICPKYWISMLPEGLSLYILYQCSS